MKVSEKCMLNVKVKRTFWQSYGNIIKTVIILFMSLVSGISVLYFYLNPFNIIKYNFDLIFIIFVLAVIGIAFLQILICKKISKRKFSGWVSIFGIVVTVATFGFYIYSVLTFSERIGTVSINNPSEIEYIQNYKYGDFTLNCDIDCNETSDIYIGNFYGNIDGQGRSITNLTTEEKAFIKGNKGNISNIVFNNPKLSVSIINKNSGSLKNITVNNPDITFDNVDVFGTICAENTDKGKIDTCTINNISINSQIQDIDLSKDKEIPKCNTFGGVCGKNEGHITNCNVLGITSQAISVSDFGGISGINGTDKLKAIIYNCQVENIDISAKFSNSFGGISGSGYANYLACETAGNVKFVSENDADFGGIAGRLNASGIIKHSSNSINFDTESSHANIGGIAGKLYGNTLIETSQNNGSVNVVVSTAEDNDDVYIGGIVGTAIEDNCLIKNVVNTASLKLDVLNYDNSIEGSFMNKSNTFAVAGIYGGTDWRVAKDFSTLTIENCYPAGSVTAIGQDISGVGGLQSCAGRKTADISSSFFAGTFSFSDRNAGNLGWVAGMSNNNNYYSSISGYKDGFSGYFEKAEMVSISKFKNADFITNTLGWDENIWSIESGKVPSIKPYIADDNGVIDMGDQVVKLIEDENDKMDPLEKQILVFGLMFIIGLAIMIGFALIIGGTGKGNSSSGYTTGSTSSCGNSTTSTGYKSNDPTAISDNGIYTPSQSKYTMKDLDEAQFGSHPVDWNKEQEIRSSIFGSQDGK